MTTSIAKRLVSVKKIPELYPGAFSEAAIRWLIFNEKQNGISKCLRRLGRKLLIDLDEFEAWIDQHGQGGAR